MTEQDTFYKLRDNICAGMKIEHKYRQMGASQFSWFCTIDELDAENNIIKVTITNGHGHSHFEDWNMQHTVNGLANGDYIVSRRPRNES